MTKLQPQWQAQLNVLYSIHLADPSRLNIYSQDTKLGKVSLEKKKKQQLWQSCLLCLAILNGGDC